MEIKNHIGQLMARIETSSLSEDMKARQKNLIKEYLQHCLKYVAIVIEQGIAIQEAGTATDQNTLQELADIDKSRSRVHDSLIAKINILNRICEIHEIPPLYMGSDNRREKGDFAFQTISEYFEDRL
ncbi:DUF3232 domain-containing protein [Syntrophomonas erecta]